MVIVRMAHPIAALVAPEEVAVSEVAAAAAEALADPSRAPPGLVLQVARAAGPLPIPLITTSSGRAHQVKAASAGLLKFSILKSVRPAMSKYGPKTGMG